MSGTRRRALLVSGSIHPGGDATAAACTATLEAYGWSTQVLELSPLLGRAARPVAQITFRSLLTIPGLYDAFHFAALRTGARPALIADAVARRKLVPRVREFLDQNRAELIVSLCPVGTAAVSALRHRYPSSTHVVFCPDAAPHRLWVRPGVDLYLVTAAAARPSILRFAPDARVLVVPPAIRAEFYRPPQRKVARVGLGIGAGDKCVAVMACPRGLGPLADIAEALATAGLEVLAVAGPNARLERKLRAVAARQPRLRAFGSTDRVPELMAAADLVITSVGRTCAEARTVGRPMLLLDVVQGHGRVNLQHELELGDADVTSRRPADVVTATLACLDRIEPKTAAPSRSLADWEDRFCAALATVSL